MTVKELINKLNLLDQNAEVIIKSSNFELNGAQVPVSLLYQTDKGSKKIKAFTDAFDGQTYNKEVWSMLDGDLSVVLIS